MSCPRQSATKRTRRVYDSFWHRFTIVDTASSSCKNRQGSEHGDLRRQIRLRAVCGNGDVAQLGERCLRKAEAEGSTPFISTILFLIKYLTLPVKI